MKKLFTNKKVLAIAASTLASAVVTVLIVKGFKSLPELPIDIEA